MNEMFDHVIQDLRFAARQLRRSPGFTATVLLTLMLSIGATTAMISVLRATLLNATPYPEAAQLVAIHDTNLKSFQSNGLVTVARAADLAQTGADPGRDGQHGRLFSHSAFFYFDQPSLAVDGRAPISVAAAAASGDFFGVLRTSPMLGRSFLEADDAHGAAEVAVISYGLWQRSFGADPGVVGKSVLLGGRATTLIGVMPQHFDYPGGTELWKPAHLTAQDFGGYRGSNTRFVSVIARLNPLTSVEDARRGTALLARRLAQSYEATDADWGFEVTSLRSEIFGSYRQGLLLLSASVGILLLIACANIAGLQLSRNAKRLPEMALRRALGGTNRRLMGQLLTESLLLLLTGGAMGCVAAMVLLRSIVARLPAAVVVFDRPHMDGTTMAVSIAAVLGVGVLCTIFPALQFRRTSAGDALSPGHDRTVANETRRFRGVFAALQIALALVLLTLATSLLQNLYRLLQTPLGYKPSQVLTTSVHLPFGSDMTKTHHFHQQLEQRIAALPGVEAVGAISALPLEPFSFERTGDIEGQRPTPHHDAVSAEGRSMTPSYLAAMQIPLLAGRLFTERDGDAHAPAVALVNQSFAAKYFPQENAIGKRLRMGGGTVEIVGVTGNVHGTGGNLNTPVLPEIDSPEDGGWPDMHFAIRTVRSSSTLEPELRRQLSSLDSGAALGTVELLAGSIDHALVQPRLNSGLLTALAGLALLLVLVGVYGVIAFSVVQRTRELGVRMALGSTRAAIFRLLLFEAVRILTGGLLLGAGASTIAAHLLIASVAGVTTSISGTLIATSLLLTFAVLMASLIPARRAASTDPMQALRTE